MVYLGSYLMDTYNDVFTSYYSSQVITDYILSDLDAYLYLEDEVIYYQVDVIPTSCYTTMLMLFYETLILNLLPTSYVIKTISSSDVAISSVCK